MAQEQSKSTVHLVDGTHCFITGKTRSKAIRIANKQMPTKEHIAPILMITPKFKNSPSNVQLPGS